MLLDTLQSHESLRNTKAESYEYAQCEYGYTDIKGINSRDFPPMNKSIFFVKEAIFCKKI